jgi:hypothetical protein
MSEEIKYGRKRNGIAKQLNEKIGSWIASITDEAVREAAKKDTIVTGGSIASMLLGDPVNDYDVYFRTKETTLLVAQYYVDLFNKNKKAKEESGGDIVSYEPVVKEVEITNCKGQSEECVIIYMQSAGVAAETQTPYQYFEQSGADETENFGESLRATSDNDKDYRPVFLSENAITLSGKIQIVNRFYGSPDEIHDNYDFIHACNYYDYDSKELVLKPEALEALLSRTLVYRGSLFPIASLFRLKKFLNRGWRCSAGQMLKIAFQISELDLSNFNTLKVQLTGVDMAYMWQLIEALKDVESEKINSTYVAVIIDKIFGE